MKITRYFLQIGGGEWARLSMRSFSKAGFKILMTDKNSSAIGRDVADYFLHANAEVDHEQIIEFVKAKGKTGSVVLANIAGEFGIKVLSKLSKLNVVEWLSPFDPWIYTDKVACAEVFKAHGLNTANRIEVVRSLPELRSKLESRDLPFVIKPSCGSGGEGVRIFDKKSVLMEEKARLLKAMSNCPRLMPQFQFPLIVEDFFNGIEVNIYGLLRCGQFTCISLIEKQVSNGSDPFWTRSYLVRGDLLSVIPRLTRVINHLVKSLSLSAGYFGLAARVNDKEIHVLEIVPMIGLDHIFLSNEVGLERYGVLDTEAPIPCLNEFSTYERGLMVVKTSQNVQRWIEKTRGSNWFKNSQVRYYPLDKKGSCDKVICEKNSFTTGFLVARNESRCELEKAFDDLENEPLV